MQAEFCEAACKTNSIVSVSLSQLIMAMFGHEMTLFFSAKMRLPTQIPSLFPLLIIERPVMAVSAATSVVMRRDERLPMIDSDRVLSSELVELVGSISPASENEPTEAGTVFTLAGGDRVVASRRCQLSKRRNGSAVARRS